MTLHDRLEAAVRARLSVAREATPGPWVADPTGTVAAQADLVDDMLTWPNGPSEVAECYRSERPTERADNAAHIAANSPDRIIRDGTEDLWLLSLHQPHPNDVRNGFDPECTCGYWQQRTCPNVLSLARRYGITEVSDGGESA